MKSYDHTTGRMIVISLLLGVVASEMACAVPATMPAGSTVWMGLRGSACDANGDADCLGSNQLGANGIPLTTFSESNGAWATGSAEINSALAIGTTDLLNTVVISFDLPQGVYLASAQGVTFGAPVPVPAAAWLFASVLICLIASPRQNLGNH